MKSIREPSYNTSGPFQVSCPSRAPAKSSGLAARDSDVRKDTPSRDGRSSLDPPQLSCPTTGGVGGSHTGGGGSTGASLGGAVQVQVSGGGACNSGSSRQVEDTIVCSAEKRPKVEDDTPAPLHGVGKGLFTSGINRYQGVDSLLDTMDVDLAEMKTAGIASAYDPERLKERTPDRILEHALGDAARVSVIL